MLDERLDRDAHVRLTSRQADCVALVAQGLSSKEIARELGISPSTVDNHIATAMHQFGFPNRSAVARWFLEQGASAPLGPVTITKRHSDPSFLQVRIPTVGGIRNSLSLKERLFAVVQVMIVSTMAASAFTAIVLGLIFFLKLATPPV